MSDPWTFSSSPHPSNVHHSSLSDSNDAPLTSPSSFQGHGNQPHAKVPSNHLLEPLVASPQVPHPQVTSPNFHHAQVTPSHLPHCQVTPPLLSSHQFNNPHLFQQPQGTCHHYVPQSPITSSYHLAHHPQTPSPHVPHPHMTSPHFAQQPQVTSPHNVSQPQMTSPHQNHFSSPNHNPGLDPASWSRSEQSPELSCLLSNYTYSYQIQSSAHLDLNLQNQSQISNNVTQQLENTHRPAYHTGTFSDGGLYAQGGTPGPVENTWDSLSELECSPLNSLSEGATMGKWSSIDFSSLSAEDFSNSQFFPESYHDNNASQSFCSPTTPGPSPHYPQTPTISSPGPQMHPRTERLNFSTQVNINKAPSCCLHESSSYPVTPDPGQHPPNETSTCLLPSQAEPLQDQSCFSPQRNGQDVSSAAHPPSVPAGLNWKEESGGRGRRRGGGGRGGGGDCQPDWTRMKPAAHETASGASGCRLQCTVCKRDFRSLPALNGHMRSHSGVRATACIKKGEDASSNILPSGSLVMPVSVPVQSRGASKACRTGQRRCSRLPAATGGPVLYHSLMHLKEEDAVTSGNKDGKALIDGDKVLDGGGSHYTPPPMLCPLRAGTGLYCSLSSKSQRAPLHNTRNGVTEPVAIATLTTGIHKPRINVGRGFQAHVPPLRDRKRAHSDSHNAQLLWTPRDELEQPVNQKRVEAVMKMTGSSVIPGGRVSPEYALHVLSESRGDFLRTVEKLLSAPDASTQPAGWSAAERRLLLKSLQLHHKDFSRIQKAVQTKSLSQCVEFYYLWKKKLSLTAKTPTGLTITLPSSNGQSSSKPHGAS